MMWVAWRQFRAQAMVTAAVVAGFGAVLLVTGLGLFHAYAEDGLTACRGLSGCASLARNFLIQEKGSFNWGVFHVSHGLVYLAPALIGLFWGAPLVAREAESGTFPLAWNQTVSRTRWLVVKLGLIGLAAVLTAGLLSVMAAWWASPLLQAAAKSNGGALSPSRFEPLLFGAQGLVPLGYAAFAFTLGVAAGLLIRRTIPAMALTLTVFATVQVSWLAWIRPHLIAPVRESVPLDIARIDSVSVGGSNQMLLGATADKPGAWVLSNQIVNSAGQPYTGPATHACQGSGIQACTASIARLHLRQVIRYEPASRYWALQWSETAIYLAVALTIAGLCVWWIKRRRLT